MVKVKKRRTSRQPAATFYLGVRALRDLRLKKLDEIAGRFGLTRSGLLQRIADEELAVTDTRQANGYPVE